MILARAVVDAQRSAAHCRICAHTVLERGVRDPTSFASWWKLGPGSYVSSGGSSCPPKIRDVRECQRSRSNGSSESGSRARFVNPFSLFLPHFHDQIPHALCESTDGARSHGFCWHHKCHRLPEGCPPPPPLTFSREAIRSFPIGLHTLNCGMYDCESLHNLFPVPEEVNGGDACLGGLFHNRIYHERRRCRIRDE